MNEFKKKKVRVLFVDCFGNYSFHDLQSFPQACTWFRHAISRSDCFLCDMRYCGDLESFASYKNYKHIVIKGENISFLKKKFSKSIILVGYRSSNGNFVPTFYFETQEQFESWFNDNKIISGNLIFFKLSIPLYDDLSSIEKINITDFIKQPSI